MTIKCREMEVIAGCLTHADGSQVPVSIHYEYMVPKVPNGQPSAVVITKTTYTDAAGVPLVLAAADVITPGACPVLVANPIHYCTETGCLEGKAWYRSGNATLVKYTDLDGNAVIPASPPREGPCQIDKVTERPVCVKMNPNGEQWNVIERITVTECGVVTLDYYDPDTSPMKVVTANVGSFISHGDCDCF
jgi:hypothetical protein